LGNLDAGGGVVEEVSATVENFISDVLAEEPVVEPENVDITDAGILIDTTDTIDAIETIDTEDIVEEPVIEAAEPETSFDANVVIDELVAEPVITVEILAEPEISTDVNIPVQSVDTVSSEISNFEF